jgi:hypothetical protein
MAGAENIATGEKKIAAMLSLSARAVQNVAALHALHGDTARCARQLPTICHYPMAIVPVFFPSIRYHFKGDAINIVSQQPVRSAYQPPAISTFLSERTSH